MNNIHFKQFFLNNEIMFSIYIYIYTFICDYVFYGLQGDFQCNNTYVCVKIITALLIYILVNRVCNADWNSYYGRLYKNIFLICLLLNIIWIILTYPGTWKWDDMIILHVVSYNGFYFWQHWLSSFYYMLCLQFIPVPVGIVFVQNVIIAAIIAYIITNFKIIYKNNIAYIFLLFLCIPSIVENNLYPMRSTICAYIELLIIFNIIFFYKKMTLKRLYIVTVIASVIAAWRPENLLWCIAIPIIMIIGKQINVKTFCTILMVSISIYFGINYYQISGLSKCIMHTEYGDINEMDRYILTGFIQPLGKLIEGDYKSKSNGIEEEYINECIDINMMKEKGGLYAFWNGGLKVINREKINKLQKIYIDLIINNPDKFMNERIDSFIESNNGRFSRFSTLIYNTNDGLYDEFVNKYLFNKRLLCNRDYFVAFLENENSEYKYTSKNITGINFYNIIPVMCLIFIIFIIEFIRKNYIIVTIIAVMMIKLLILIFTIPMSVYMYIFATHLTGLGIIIYWIIANFNKKCLLGENK